MTITATQLRTLALLNAGYASEVQSKSSFVLSWAMTYKADGTAKNNSGYSLGTLQSDLGQRPYLAGDLVHSYYQWAGSDTTRLVGRTEAQLTAVMQEQGRAGLVATTAFVNIAYGGDQIAAVIDGYGDLLDASSGVETALPYLNVINGLITGDPAAAAAYALIKAIQNHQHLPALSSGLSLYNDVFHTVPPQLTGVTGALGAAFSLYNFSAALEHGDVTGAFVAGANAFTQGVNAYAYAYIVYGSSEAAVKAGLGELVGAAKAVGEALPFLNVANDLVQGNVGAAVDDALGTYVATLGHQMSTLTLKSETAGNAYTPHGDGIQVTSTSGQVSLVVTHMHDLSRLQPNAESFSTDENVPADCYDIDSWLRPYLLGYGLKLVSKIAINDTEFRIAA